MADKTATNAVGEPTTEVGKYIEVIEAYETQFAKWMERCKKINKIYGEQRAQNANSARRYAMLWANISTLQPTVYARVPKPVVVRRFKDKDKVARAGGELIERADSYMIEKGCFDAVMKKARDDLLLFSRGTAWNRYEAKFEPQVDDQGQQLLDEAGKPMEKITDEKVSTDFVLWYDFGHSLARIWEEVWLVWRIVYLDREELIKRFGKEVGTKIPLDQGPKNKNSSSSNKIDAKTKATIYECWDKRNECTVWVSKGHTDLCDKKAPLVDLENFFPCSKPMYGTLLSDSLEPIPDYVYYQDQAEEINAITNKIDKLCDSLKLVGFYPAGTEGTAAIIKAMKADSSDMLVPIAGWNAWAEKGGAAQIQWVPIDVVIKVLEGCYNARDRLIQDIFQIMGISDIQRGQTDPNETAQAQNLKSQYGSLRTQERQKMVQEFARDNIRIISEIMAEKFQPETLLMMTGMKFPTAADVQAAMEQQKQAAMAAQQQQLMAQQAPAQQAPAPGGQPPMPPGGPSAGSPPNMMPPQPGLPVMGGNGGPAGPMPGEEGSDDEPLGPDTVTMEKVFEFLRNDKLRGYRIDIETDSTIIADEQADKAAWNEMLTAVSTFMTSAMPIGGQIPEFVPVLGEILQATFRKYNAGKSLEDAVETAVNALISKTKKMMAMPPQPPPEQIVAETKAKAIDQKGQIDLKLGDQKLQQGQLDLISKQQDMVHTQHNHQTAQQDHLAAQEAANLAQFDQHIASLDKHHAHQTKIDQSNEVHQTKLDQSAESHKHKLTEKK